MSLVSHLLGLDKHKDLLRAINHALSALGKAAGLPVTEAALHTDINAGVGALTAVAAQIGTGAATSLVTRSINQLPGVSFTERVALVNAATVLLATHRTQTSEILMNDETVPPITQAMPAK